MPRFLSLLSLSSLFLCTHAMYHGKPYDKPSTASPTVVLDSGIYVGTTTQLATASPIVNKFLGIPFAAPPTRFERPQPVPKSTAQKDATTLPPVCYQQFNYPELSRTLEMGVFNNPAPQESEDCLYVNVFAPAEVGSGGKAVLFWIFGGGFQFGGGSLQQYDGSSFAANQDVIVVTHNYRTNVFGFPGDSPDVPDTSKNLGLHDQRAALQWVQQNIAEFGGDPKKVTIFGESAGAASVDLQILTNPSDPPFRAAILQSGSASLASTFSLGGNPTVPPIQTLAEALDCTSNTTVLSAFNCVKNAPAAVIKSTIEQNVIGFPVLAKNDSTVPSSEPLDLRRNGQVADVPILIGSNAAEFQIFLWFALGGDTASVNFTSFVGNLVPIPGVADALRQAYPQSTYPTDFEAVSALVTDVAFNCPAALVANISANAGYPTWRYLYNATFPNTTPFPGAGPYHASEIPQVFGVYPERTNTTLAGPTEEELALSQWMQTAWAEFAKNPENGPGFNSYAMTAPQTFGVFGGNETVAGSNVTNTNVLKNEVVDTNDRTCAVFNTFLENGGLPGS